MSSGRRQRLDRVRFTPVERCACLIGILIRGQWRSRGLALDATGKRAAEGYGHSNDRVEAAGAGWRPRHWRVPDIEMRGSLAKFLACPLPPPQPFDQTSDRRNEDVAGAPGVSSRAHPHSQSKATRCPVCPGPAVHSSRKRQASSSWALRGSGRSQWADQTFGVRDLNPEVAKGCLGKPTSCVRKPTESDPTKELSDATPNTAHGSGASHLPTMLPGASRVSRQPPSNHTRTCNKLREVYM